MMNGPWKPPEPEKELATPPDSGSRGNGDGAPELDRLPPPAFPPGSRHAPPGSEERRDDEEETADQIPDAAFISYEEPIRKLGRGIPDDAFISPDDPLVPRARDEEGRVVDGEDESAFRPHDTSPTRRARSITVDELPYLLDQLAERLHESGPRALDVHPDMGHFQAALRAFLKGYLEGGRD